MSNFPFTIALSASIPSGKRSVRYNSEFIKIKNAQIQIEEAIIGLSRNIFHKKGRLIFGGHPSISPLVGMVANEFNKNFNEFEGLSGIENFPKPILIFQSRAFENFIPKHTIDLLNKGNSTINWTKSVNGEVYKPELENKEQCIQSLFLMRKEMMMEDIDALICIGGMEGVESEFNIFKEAHPKKPIYVFETTGGASAILAKQAKNNDMIKVIDYEFVEKNEEKNEFFNLIPFGYISALIIQDIIERKNSTRE